MGTDATGPGRQGTLFAPSGNYRLKLGELALNRAILLKGAAPGGRQSGEGPSRLVFDALNGIRIYSLENDPACVGDATYAAIEDLQIEGFDNTPTFAMWTASHGYTIGDRILPRASRATKEGSSWEYYYECVKGGITDATEPDWPGTAAPGNVPIQSIMPAFGPRAGSTPYQPRTVVRAANRWDVVFVCTTAGTSLAGGDPANFASAVPGDVIGEPPSLIEWTAYTSSGYLVAENGTLASPGANTVIWACRVSSGIYAQTRFCARRVTISGFLNAGVTVQAAGQTLTSPILQPGNANGFSIYDLDVINCGGGIMTRGHDVNASCVSNAHIRTWPGDDRAFGIADKGQGGNRYLSCSIDQCGGPPLDQRSASSTGSFFGCFASSLCGPSIIGTSNGYDIFGNDFQSGLTVLPQANVLGAIGPDEWREVWMDDGTTSAKLYASPYLMAANAPTETFLAVGYNFAGVGLGGWWTWFVGSSIGSALAWSGANAAEGAGNLWAFNGLFIGDTRTILTADSTKPDLGAGTWRQGDIVINQGAASGLPSYWQCVVAGTPGTWADGPSLP